MKLGPIQQAWVKSLKNHAERQTHEILGYLNCDAQGENIDDSVPYYACCLGELAIQYYLNTRTITKSTELFNQFNYSLVDNINLLHDEEFSNQTALDGIFPLVGLHSEMGEFRDPNTGSIIQISGETSLAKLNDTGMSWPEIAEIVENYSKYVFVKSI